MIKVSGRDVAWRPGMTLAQLMDALDDGRLYAVVRLNGRLVSRPDFDKTTIPDGAEVLPMPLIAGG